MKKLSLIILICVLPLIHLRAQSNNEIHFGLGNAKIVKYSPASDLIAIAVGNKLKLFRSGIQIASLASNNGKISALNFDPDGKYLLTGHASGKLNIWNVKGQKLDLDIRPSHHQILSCKFLESSGKIAVLTKESLSILTTSGKVLTEAYNHYAHNIVMDVSEDGKSIAVADSESTITIYNPRGEPRSEWRSEQKWILSLAFTPDGKSLATGSTDGSVHL